MKSGGWKHSEETRAKIRATMSDPAMRAVISAATKAGMADPAVRRRIKEGMKRAADERDEIKLLRVAWRASSPDARRRFLAELLPFVPMRGMCRHEFRPRLCQEVPNGYPDPSAAENGLGRRHGVGLAPV